jgi:hypothetical protein
VKGLVLLAAALVVGLRERGADLVIVPDHSAGDRSTAPLATR